VDQKVVASRKFTGQFTLFPMRGDDSYEARARKPSKPFEGAVLPRVNKTRKKEVAESSKSITLPTKKASTNAKPVQKPTKKSKTSKRGQLGTI